MKKLAFSRLLLAGALAFSLAAGAQDYPSKPLKIVVPYPPGGVTDVLSRMVAEKLREKWNLPVLVDNRPGASGNIGAEYVSKASPDGYTVMVCPPSPLVTNKALYAKLAYDPDAFVPVTVISTAPVVLMVNQKVPAETLQELISLAKANPGKFNYASGGGGSHTHLTSELFVSMAGITMGHIPYKGMAPAVVDVLTGQVEMVFTELGNALPHIRSGKIRVLAVAGEKRTPMMPQIPSVSEVLPGFVSMVWVGMAAPPGTPLAIANRLSAAVAEALKQPDVAKRLLDLNNEAIGNTPAEMAQFLRQERERWGNVIRTTGIKAE